MLAGEDRRHLRETQPRAAACRGPESCGLQRIPEDRGLETHGPVLSLPGPLVEHAPTQQPFDATHLLTYSTNAEHPTNVAQGLTAKRGFDGVDLARHGVVPAGHPWSAHHRRVADHLGHPEGLMEGHRCFQRWLGPGLPAQAVPPRPRRDAGICGSAQPQVPRSQLNVAGYLVPEKPFWPWLRAYHRPRPHLRRFNGPVHRGFSCLDRHYLALGSKGPIAKETFRDDPRCCRCVGAGDGWHAFRRPICWGSSRASWGASDEGRRHRPANSVSLLPWLASRV